ncbi:hypothetical protein FDENT_7666 [Fusarium denticulatum]|uniref:Uncharacterized protein n=1 Tax=Fusarium denticulatum TaxID=48507 RepID=A0A8H5U6W9_9HYPO|nr:hypothetical protein FDENT_7666 [Fusarium denticulatum]
MALLQPPSENPALPHRSDSDKNGDSPRPGLLRITAVILCTVPLVSINPPSSHDPHQQNKPVCPKSKGALGSSTDQEQNPSNLLGTTNPTQPTEIQASKRKTDEKKRKVSPKIQNGNRKQLKTNTDKNAPSAPIQINSDGESESDGPSDSDSLLDKLAECSNEQGDELESSGDESENSDNEGQKTNDERHLPRPPKTRTDKELKVTRSNRITHPEDELEEGLGEDEAGNLKDVEVPAHTKVGNTGQIANKGPKPDHHVMEKQSAKDRIDLEQGKPKTEVPIKAFQLMIHYAMRTALRAGKRTQKFHPIWQKDLDLVPHLDAKSGVFRVFRCTGPDSNENPVIYDMAVKYLSSTNFFNAKHLRSAIELGETVSWGKGSRGQLLMLGRRGEEESVLPHLSVSKSTKPQTKKRKKLPEAIPEPYPANVINIQQAVTGFMQPYPFRPSLPTAPITKIITAEEWERQNKLLEAPILPRVEVEDDTNQEILNVETGTAQRSIRAIETAALSLPKAHQKTAALIKQHKERLFACRDHEIDNHTLMAQSVAKRPESSPVTATTLQIAFEDNETRLLSRIDTAQVAREKGLEALEADMQNVLKIPTVDGSANQLVLFLKTHWRMRDHGISDWQDMANSACHTAKEAGHPINQSDQETCDNHDWNSLLRLAITRGGKALDSRDKAEEQGDVTQQTEPIDNIVPDTFPTPSQDTPQAPETMDNVEHNVAVEAAFLNLLMTNDDPTSTPKDYGQKVAMKEKYSELLGLPLDIEHRNPLTFAIAPCVHGRQMRTGWALNSKTLADRDDSVNNILIETRSSNSLEHSFAEVDYPMLEQFVADVRMPLYLVDETIFPRPFDLRMETLRFKSGSQNDIDINEEWDMEDFVVEDGFEGADELRLKVYRLLFARILQGERAL